MSNQIKAIDAWVSASLPREKSIVNYLFTDITERYKGITVDECVEMMDANGVEKSILALGYNRRFEVDKEADQWCLDAVNKYPDRFVLTVKIDPRKGMQAVREIESYVKNHNAKGIRLTGFDTQKPYNDRIFYPIYSKCIELDIPVSCNVGIPAPLVPAASQDPMALDDVCWFFPELKVVMAHGGEPWTALCVKLMLKWPNLTYMTSAFAPKYYPQDIVNYMNTRGADKIMYATGYPLIDISRAMKEIKGLPLKEHVWPKFLRENAIRVFKLQSEP